MSDPLAIQPLDIPITFGICAGPYSSLLCLNRLIDSIRAQNVPEYEILILESRPSYEMEGPDLRTIVCEGWLPFKKNIISKEAKYETLCIVHDYYQFDENWYEGIQEYITSAEKYKKRWDVMCCYVQRLEDGERGPDWVINPYYLKKFLEQPENEDVFKDLKLRFPDENHPMYVVGLNPFEERLTKIQYNSGGYIFCKRHILQNYPFDEKMRPGTPEDVEWYERVKKNPQVKLRFNPFAIVYTQKPNKWKVYPFPPEYYSRLLAGIEAGLFNDVKI